MNRQLATYKEAEDRVKIAHFTRKGIDITGIVHVGAHTGQEVAEYLRMGIEPIVAFEPFLWAFSELRNTFSEAIQLQKLFCYPYALGDETRVRFLNVTDGEGQGSSFLHLEPGSKGKDYYQKEVGLQPAVIVRGGDFCVYFNITMKFNCLVVDTQGMELDVLRGMGAWLGDFECLSIECSERAIYIGGVPASDVIDYLKQYNFIQDSPIEEHNDIMFLRKDIYDRVNGKQG